MKRLNELERAFTVKEIELRTKRSRLRDLGQEVGTIDAQAISFNQQMLIQACSDVRRQLSQLQADKWKAEGELRGQEALAKDPELAKSILSLQEYATLLADPIYSNLGLQAASLAISGEQPGVRLASSADRMQTSARHLAIEHQLELRRKTLQKEMHENRLAKHQAEIIKLTGQVAILGKQEMELQTRLDKLNQKAANIGALSADLDMLRNDIKQSEDVLNGIAKERDHLTVELASAPRVSLVQPPEVPPVPDQTVRMATTGFAFLVGFLGSVGVAMILCRREKPDRSALLHRPLSKAAILITSSDTSEDCIEPGDKGQVEGASLAEKVSDFVEGCVVVVHRGI